MVTASTPCSGASVSTSRSRQRSRSPAPAAPSIKYSPEGGDVAVTVRAHLGKVEFAVSDQGIGIPAAKQHLIFEKFYRAEPDMDHGISGTGLGLYICRELIQRMHGTISVTSEPGRGSTFTIRLPRVDRA